LVLRLQRPAAVVAARFGFAERPQAARSSASQARGWWAVSAASAQQEPALLPAGPVVWGVAAAVKAAALRAGGAAAEAVPLQAVRPGAVVLRQAAGRVEAAVRAAERLPVPSGAAAAVHPLAAPLVFRRDRFRPAR
jgi:hypothetical protein